MLEAAKNRIDAGKNPPIIMADAWNEWGEGHWSEPDAGRGFSYLDAIRSVFADSSAHTDLAPTDAGLPLVQTIPSTALWTFNDSSDLLPWYGILSVSNSQVANNQWTFSSRGTPDLDRGGFKLSASDYPAVAITMSVSANTNVYWGAEDEPLSSAARSASFVAQADGAMQTYTLTPCGQARVARADHLPAADHAQFGEY